MSASLSPAPVPKFADDALDSRHAWLGALIIFVLTLFAYYPAMHAGYIWDDDQYVSENRLLQQGLDGLRDIWTPRKTPQYYPAVFTMFWVEHQLWGLNPHGYHIVNIIIHALNAILVWRLARMLKIPWAWLSGAVFALHPVHVESVAWITERKNTLSALFYLLAAMAYLKFDDQQELDEPSPRRWLMYALALACFVLALLSKSVTCSLPAALILMMLWQRKPLASEHLAPLVPLFVIGLGFALNTAHIEREHVGAFGEDFQFSIADRLLIASNALLFYVQKILWPWPVIFIYPRWLIDDSQPLHYWPLAAVIAIAIGLIVLYVRGIRGPGLALAFFAGTVLPALGFVNVYPMVFSFVADHFQYLASLGVITLVVGLLSRLLKSRDRMIVTSALILLPLGAMTFVQCYEYEDAETLYRTTLAKNDGAFMAHNNLAAILLRRSQDFDEQALSLLQQGRRDDAQAKSQQAEETRAEAYAHLIRALELKERYPQVLGNLADLMSMYGHNAEALAYSQRALDVIRSYPQYLDALKLPRRPAFKPISDAFRQTAKMQMLVGQYDDAKANYLEAIAWLPNDVGLLGEYDELLLKMNDLDGAAATYQRVLALDPNNVGALGTLAEIMFKKGDGRQAAALYQRAIAAAAPGPERDGWRVRHIRMLATSNDPATRDTRQAVRLAEALVAESKRGDPMALDVLSQVLAEDGRIDDAIRIGEEAANLAQRLRFDDLSRQIRSRVDGWRAKPASSPSASTAPST